MNIDLSFANNTLTTYQYEQFSYTISNPPGSSTLSIGTSLGIPPGYLVNYGSNVVFSNASNGMAFGNSSFFNLLDSSGNTSSNSVIVKAGRFLDSNGNSFDGQTFAFYKNEPITPIQLVAPFAISAPTSAPTLPPGLIYTANDSNIYSITGTPLATVPQSNYLIIGNASGSNLGKVVTSRFGLSVSNERIAMTLTGGDIVSNMTVDTPISQRVITSLYPPYPSGGTLRYTWSGLPNGIIVTDGSGTTQTSPFTPSDTLSTLIVQGAPTLTAANAYRNADIRSNTVVFTATRTNPLPQLSNTIPITFSFGETVLFDTPSVPPFYNGVTLESNATYFRAQTYFGTASPISNITAPSGLPSGLFLTFVPGTGLAYLRGTPDTVGSASYTIRAVNSNGISRDISVPITVTSDFITFLSAPSIDVCYNFVLSRPLSLDLSGYYTPNIQFQAVAASGKPVTFSTSSFTGTGLSLSNVNSNTVQLVGIAEAITPLTTATITASAVGTPATASTTFKYEIIDDEFTFNTVSASQFQFIQNRDVTPIQITVDTLSGRPVVSFVKSNFPAGLNISATGNITGAPLPSSPPSPTLSVIASTGYTSKSNAYAYSITPDSVLLLVDPQYAYYNPPVPVSIDIDGLTYSGRGLSNFAFSGFSPTYGLSIDASTGTISGTLSSGVPPDAMYTTTPINYTVTASAGLLPVSLPSTFTASNVIVHRSFLLADDINGGGNALLYKNDDDEYTGWTDVAPGGTNLSLKNTSVDSNVYLVATGSTAYSRSTDGVNWTNISNITTGETSTIYQFLYDSNSSKWYGAGTSFLNDEGNIVEPLTLFSSSDDGLSWTKVSTMNTSPRQALITSNYYTIRGLAFALKDGVFLMGGARNSSYDYFTGSTTIRRSTDGGFTWDNIAGGSILDTEVGAFETAGSNWIVVGSSLYSSGSNYNYFTFAARTIAWSGDQGSTWGYGTGDVFNVLATQVVYDGSGTWLATGLNRANEIGGFNEVITGLSYSTDAKAWTGITLPGITFTQFSTGMTMPLPEINAIWTYGSNWYVFVKTNDTGNYVAKILTHAIGGDMTTGWSTYADPAVPFDTLTQQYVHGFKTNYVRTANPTTITLDFQALPSGGPTLTSPTERRYNLYQYIPMTSVTFTGAGTGTVYYFVDSSTLPVGLRFDPITATLSGTPMNIGETNFTLYLKDDIGVSRVTIGINVVIAQVIRQQTSAGAWTSFIRQYTVVNAAQNSVNGRVLPATEPTLGEFMRPEPPDSVSASGDPNCAKKKC